MTATSLTHSTVVGALTIALGLSACGENPKPAAVPTATTTTTAASLDSDPEASSDDGEDDAYLGASRLGGVRAVLETGAPLPLHGLLARWCGAGVGRGGEEKMNHRVFLIRGATSGPT